MDKITASWETLVKDGFYSASTYFHQVIESIDNEFGKGYAKEHPELIGAYMNAAAKGHQATVIGKCIQELAEEIEKAGDAIYSGLNNISEELPQ